VRRASNKWKEKQEVVGVDNNIKKFFKCAKASWGAFNACPLCMCVLLSFVFPSNKIVDAKTKKGPHCTVDFKGLLNFHVLDAHNSSICIKQHMFFGYV